MLTSNARRCLMVALTLSLPAATLCAQQGSDNQHQGHQHQGHGHEAHQPEVQGRDLARLKREIPPPSEQNLDFEAGESAAPWILGGRGYSLTLDKDNPHSGKRSLRIRYEDSGRYAVASLPFDAKTVHGKRLRLTGYMKTDDVSNGHAGLWMRVDVGHHMVEFDNMDRRGVTGDTPWTQYVVELDVPPEATRIFYGAVLTGIGTLWVDDLTIEGFEIVPAKRITVEGEIRAIDGDELQGAVVALAEESTLVRSTQSDENGRYRFDEVPAGLYQVTAGGRDGFAASAVKEYPSPDGLSNLRLSRGHATITGRVIDLEGKPMASAELEVVLWGSKPRIFAVRTDAEGMYRFAGPTAELASLRLIDEKMMAVERLSELGEGEHTVDLQAYRRGVRPNGVTGEFGIGSSVLATTHPTRPVGELSDLADMVGDSRIVALGESSPGTEELFEFKHRLSEYLIEEKGFSIVALPLTPELGDELDRHVQSGDGDPGVLLKTARSWSFKTEEALALIQRLQKARAADSALRVIGYAGGSDEQQAARIHEALGTDGKLVLWGHNRSVSRAAGVGAVLAERSADDYYAFGGFFGQGAFLAVDQTSEAGEPQRVWMGPAPRDYLEDLFVGLGGKLSIQNLRPFGPETLVGKWLAIPRVIRDMDERYWSEKALNRSMALTDHFDGVFFVESTTEANLLP